MVQILPSSSASVGDSNTAHEGALLACVDEAFGLTTRSLAGDCFRLTVYLTGTMHTQLKVGVSYRITTEVTSVERKGPRRKLFMSASVTRADDKHKALMECETMFLAYSDRPVEETQLATPPFVGKHISQIF